MRIYPEKPKNVYFFGTCLVDMAYPDAGMAGIRLLEREGLRVVYPQDQSCCGQPAYNSGYMDEAREVARKQLDSFPRDWPIIVPSGSCAGMMHRHYPKLFEGDPDYFRAKAFSNRVFELTEFLVRVCGIRLADKGAPVTVTWHSSCHAMREMGIIGICKDLIGQLENVTLVELEKEYECCGFGGTFSVKQPEISAAMVRDKAEAAFRTGAQVLLTADCGCLMNITGALDRMGLAMTGKHIAEFIWERTNG
ncbi:L-lactate dehydrogenase complex protein LldE [Desulfobaculum xiamenense]|uniref:L-lactate dehydrogenase complex protein LldE n=1 Tax=Desulfobaculum xiamenense TaxID=995050 RepID=A0A846QL36_9BACT|nr:(Fe-S)-binding protein [Desulfobaculum xiamenense]NJB68831.1 L-lactate dehydrogenase complex protein LldE [Desulfobaculum xiamenense]